MKIVDCDLSVRAINCLMSAGIETVEDLCRMHRDEAMHTRSLGKKAFRELDEFLHDNGLDWGMEVEKKEFEDMDDEVKRWVVDSILNHYDGEMADRIFMALRDIATDNGAHASENMKVFVTLAEVVCRFIAMLYHNTTRDMNKTTEYTQQDMAQMFYDHLRVFGWIKYNPREESEDGENDGENDK